MKKNFLYSVMALFAILLASCSQEEIISENNKNGKVTVSVGVPGSVTTRAGMPEVEGVSRRCIMQVVDGNGTAIEGLKETKEVTGETVTFSFDEPEGDYSVVFWADYVTNLANDYIYNTEQLPIIGYKGTKNNMFTDAGDAFCGKIDKGTTSTTLKRPFNKIVVGSTNKEVFGEYTHISIGTFKVPTGYSIMDGTCGKIEDTPSASIRLEKKAINNTETGEWAYFYIFPSVDQTATDLDLNITLSKGAEDTAEKTNFVAAIKNLPTDANTIGSVNIPEIPTTPVDPEEPTKVDVVISFNDEFTNGGSTEPEEPVTPGEMKVGSYINANGEVVTSAESAIAVVFAIAKDIDSNDDAASTYGTAYENKTIKAYAVSLKNVTNRMEWSGSADEKIETLTETTTKYQGYAATETLLKLCKDFTGGMFKTFADWCSTNQTDNVNLSQWYIPTFSQLTLLTKLVFGETANADFVRIIKPQSFLTNPNAEAPSPTKGWYMTSSSINSTNKISTYTVGNGNSSQDNATYTCSSGSASLDYNTKGFVRPILTIFE